MSTATTPFSPQFPPAHSEGKAQMTLNIPPAGRHGHVAATDMDMWASDKGRGAQPAHSATVLKAGDPPSHV